jgi:hypothetical protein
VATKIAQLDQNAQPVREELAMTHLPVEHAESTDGIEDNVTSRGLHPPKFPLMCSTDSKEDDDLLAFSDEILHREVHIGIGIMDPEHVFPKALSPRFPVGGRGRMHRMRGDEFVKDIQVSCPE